MLGAVGDVVADADPEQLRLLLHVPHGAPQRRGRDLPHVAAVDEDALVRVLEAGKIRGAALDVFKEEPLPSSSPLWTLGDRILITAHNADLTEDYFDLGWAVFADNYRRFASDEPLSTLIDVSRGY